MGWRSHGARQIRRASLLWMTFGGMASGQMVAPSPAPLNPPTRSTAKAAAPATPANSNDASRPRLQRSLFEPSGESFVSEQALSGASDLIFGAEASVRQTDDVGSLLFGSQAARGVSAQQRNAVTNDVRIRGAGSAQNIGAGSYWNPGRPDLDTALNKIFSYNLDTLLVIKGPYSAQYGPGFNFIDMQLQRSPRYDGVGWNGTTSVNYESNGERWLGREHLWGGGSDWGARVSYGHSTGNDYEDGSGQLIPNSFKSRDFYASIGRDLSDSKTIEFSYLRLDQTDVEFPGLVFDMNYLVTDGFELEYSDDEPTLADHMNAELWYNRTRFEGDTLRPSKNRQIPALRTTLFSPDGVSGFGITDVDGSSTGYRVDWSWDVGTDAQLTLGTDLIYLDQTLNDIEPWLPPDDNNFPVPHSNSTDVGLFAEYREEVTEKWLVQLGGRTDLIWTRSSDFVEGVPSPLSDLKDAELDQDFTLWAAYLSTEYEVLPEWTVFAGAGASQRPPTLTELYAEQAFIGTLQRGLTFVDGDPLLAPERLQQLDLGLSWDYTTFRGGVNAFHAWIQDYITYDLTTPADPEGGLTNGIAFVNTDLATLSGVELDGAYDLSAAWTLFGRMQYVEGRDLSRNEGSRLTPGDDRSGVTDREHEPLPGIAPLDARLGIRWHDPTPQQLWGVELTSRIVARQDRIAESLQEIATPGFTVWDARSYWQLTDSVMLLTGVENFTDKFYREHLDYRSGLGVFRRGINFYTGITVAY